MAFHWKRKEKNMEEYIKEIERIAAKCTESQSDGYSQINDVNSTSGKNKKAMEIGVKVISEDQFLDMIAK